MASVRIVLRKENRKKDGTCPLVVRITKNRRLKYIFTGYSIEEKFWDPNNREVRKSHPNATRLNRMLHKKIAEATNDILDAENVKEHVTANEIRKKIKSKSGTSFYKMAEERIEEKRKQGVFSVAEVEGYMLANIKKFHNGEVLYFHEITSSFLHKFKVYCKTVLNQKSDRTISNQLMFIRTLYNHAIRLGLAKQEDYPFTENGEKIRLKNSQKIGLSLEEIRSIEALELDKKSGLWHTRNVFLFSFYFAGVRISDVLKVKWRDLQDGRLYYVMKKNSKPGSLKIPLKAQRIIELYADEQNNPDDFIFPDLTAANSSDPQDLFTKSRTAAKRFNRHLKQIAMLAGIDKTLSNHIARHSFGNISGEKISPLMLQKLYRHSDLRTTINYQANFVHKDADEALDAVLKG